MPLEQQQVAGVCIILFLVMLILRARKRKSGADFDRTLLYFTKYDRFTVRDLLSNLLTMGITGAGKSTSSALQLALALARDMWTFGMILAPKPEDLAFWQGVFKRAGQSHRLLVFDAESSPLRFNVLEQTSLYGDSRDITKAITVARDTLRNGHRGHSAENVFFEEHSELLIHHSVVIVKAAKGTVTAYDLQQFIATAAQRPDDISDEGWRGRFHNECIQAAFMKDKTPQGRHDLEQAVDYWLRTVVDRVGTACFQGVVNRYLRRSGSTQPTIEDL